MMMTRLLSLPFLPLALLASPVLAQSPSDVGRGLTLSAAVGRRDPGGTLMYTRLTPTEPSPGDPPPTRPLPDLPDEPQPTPEPGDPPSM